MRYFIVYLFLPLVFFLSSALINIIYSALLEIAPNAVPTYDRVLEKEEYATFVSAMNTVSALLSVFLVSFVTGVYDNARYEDVITKTDGLFKVKKVLPAYFKRTFPSDVIAAAIPQAVFIPLTILSHSEKFLDYFGSYLAPHLRLAEVLTPVGAYFMIFVAALFARTVAMPFALRRYRALWLTSFVDS